MLIVSVERRVHAHCMHTRMQNMFDGKASCTFELAGQSRDTGICGYFRVVRFIKYPRSEFRGKIP